MTNLLPAGLLINYSNVIVLFFFINILHGPILNYPRYEPNEIRTTDMQN